MASNQSNRFQSLDSSVEEFIDGQENENTKKKTKHDVALFHEFLVLKGEMRQMDELTPQELNKFLMQRVPYNGSQKRRQQGIRA